MVVKPSSALELPEREKEAADVSQKLGLPPIVDDQSRVLILGTLPGDESLRQQRDYCDPRNQFWRILAAAFDRDIGENYAQRLRFLSSAGVAVWDVADSAHRVGSLDAAIHEPKSNNFADLFHAYPALRRVGFNGGTAAKLWTSLVRSQDAVPHAGLELAELPSSSGTPGRHVKPFEERVAVWRRFLRV